MSEDDDEIHIVVDESEEPRQVRIVGADIPFFDLMVLMIKSAFAAIPAMIVVGGIFFLLQLAGCALIANLF